MSKKELVLSFLASLLIVGLFFYKFFLYGHIPFPGDLLIAEYNPWKAESYIGYNPGSYPNKAQYFDVLRQLYPWRMLVVEQLQGFSIPLWNPYNFSGSPLLANFQSAALYPLNIIFLTLPFNIGWAFLVMMQPLFALFFTYLYSRRIQLGIAASLFASISYAFSYFSIVWLEYNTIGHVIAFLPLLLLSTENLLTKKSIRWSLAFVLSIVVSILAGHIQIASYVLLFACVYIGFRLKYEIKKYVFFGMLLTIGIGISAVQLLPGIELINHSARVKIEHAFLFEKVLVQPKQLLMIVVPDLFGNPATRNYAIQDTYVGKMISIGLIPLFFILFSLFTKPTRVMRFYLYTIVVILLYITANPLTYILFLVDIPLLSSSSPTLSSFLLAFSFSIISGFGCEQFIKKGIKPKQIVIVSFVLVGLVGLCWAIGSNTKEMLYAIFVIGMGSVLLYSGILFKNYLYLFLLVLLVLHSAWLMRAFYKFNPFVPTELLFPNNHVFSFLQKQSGIDRYWGYKSANIEANFATQYSLFSPDGYDPLYPKRYGELIYSSEEGRLLKNFSVTTRSDAVITQKGNLIENKYRLKILELLGVSSILDRQENASTEIDFPPEKFKNIFQNNGWVIYKNSNALPRAFLTASYDTFSTKEEFDSKFFNMSNPNTVLLEKKLHTELKPDNNSKLTINSYSPNTVVINTSSSTNQLLFISDTFFPGWVGLVDGKETEILRANYAFRSLVIPSGEHIITMKYSPQSFKTGVTVSAISLFFFMILMFFTKQRYNIKDE